MQQWNYMFTDMFTGSREMDEKHFNALGEEGWELVTAAFNASGEMRLAILKRTKLG